MKKFLKITGIAVLSVVLVFTLFIVEESIRLSKWSSKPLIILEEIQTSDELTYKSIGFSITYKCHNRSNDLVLCAGQEFWLFDRFLIWGWIS